MANVCELSIKRRKMRTAKDADWPWPKMATQRVREYCYLPPWVRFCIGHAVGVKRAPKPVLSYIRNVVSPYCPSPQRGKPTVRKADGGAGKGWGESERRSVTERIRVEILFYAKARPLPQVSHHEKV